MHRTILSTLLATTALAAAAPAWAQGQPADEPTALDEIIVSARRERESLQDVPVSVQAVTGAQIQDLAITQATEISKVAPGININGPTGNGVDFELVLRGVRWTAASGTPAIAAYLNDAPFLPTSVLSSLYDVGQIEILRGPQGTTRGAPSISGAVTVTTRRPNLAEYGGYAQALIGSHDHQNVQGAVNLPLIKDKLAIRAAGSYEHTQGSQVRSLFNAADPSMHIWNGRVSLRFQPTDSFTLDAMYQRWQQKGRYFMQVAGPGSPGFAALGIPPNFNSPAISADDYLSVQDLPSTIDSSRDIVTVNASWDVMGQRLSYNFGGEKAPRREFAAIDVANVVPGFDFLPTGTDPGPGWRVHEIRLSSIRGDRFFDYDIGYFRQTNGSTSPNGTVAFLPGAFGAPFVTPPGAVRTPVSRYVLPVNSAFTLVTRNYSFYGNVQLHFSEKTELSAGLRWIHDKRPLNLGLNLGSAFLALPRFLPAAAGGCPSPLLPDSPVYGAQFCDIPLAARSSSESPGGKTYAPVIYNVSLSHKFTPDILGYATVGTSWRQGLPSINNNGMPADLIVPDPEKATSYEVGVKASFGHWLRVNADVFQIDYNGQLSQFQGIAYFNTVSGAVAQTGTAFYRNIDARVRGVEAEITLNPVEHLSLRANISYAKISSRGGLAPCNDPGRPITVANPINLCPTLKGQTLNAAPPFQASLNGAYDLPLGEFDGYVRFNLGYQGKNPAFGISDQTFNAKSNAILDLFAGVKANDGAWDIGAYAKNVFNEKALLTSSTLLNTVYAPFAAPTGLSRVAMTLPREVGVTLRYSFGSR
jgi:iron complex outermembrane receptor protein